MLTSSSSSARGGAVHRFLFSVLGGYGHLHPLVPLARALRQAGHAVAFATGESLRPIVEQAGFLAFTVDGNLVADPEYQRFQAQRRVMPLTLANECLIYTRLFCGISPRLRTPQLVELARTWHADLVIREAGEYGGAIAAEHLGLPHVTVSFAASLRGLRRFERGAAAQLDPIRQRWDLAPDPTLTALYRYGCLVYAPPSFSQHAIDESGDEEPFPAITHFLRPEIFDQAGPDGLPEWMDRLPAQPTVYVTLGTEANSEPDIYPDVLQMMIAGLREAPINLIVTLGRENDPADFGPQPPNVHIERYIPQSLLLPRCDVMVMHGGSNTLLAGIDVGLPMVVVPLIADQFFNARVLQSMQIGRMVQRVQLTPASIRAAVEEALANPIYWRNVSLLRAEMHALPDQASAVALVEERAALGGLPPA